MAFPVGPKMLRPSLFIMVALAVATSAADASKSFSAVNGSTVGEAVFGETGDTTESGGPAAGIYGLYAFTGTSGAGVFGKSMNGPGVSAETLGATSPALYALNLTTGTNAGPALLATARAGEGIRAVSDGNTGIVGITRSSTDAAAAGVSGISIVNGTIASGALGTGYAGVLGTAGKDGSGVFGIATGGQSIVGYNEASRPTGRFTSQAALYGFSTEGPGLVAFSIGGTVEDGYDSDRHTAIGGESIKGTGLAIFSAEGVGARIENAGRYDTLDIDDEAGRKNYAIQVLSHLKNTNALLLDNLGNLTIEGKFVAKDGAITPTRNPASDRMTYAAQSTQATVEDVGSAQLIDGRAVVVLAPDFRETIDGTSAYAIFLTPYGDSRGLYVAQRSAAGFVVREAQGGRSTMPFDYRVVARQYGVAERLPHAEPPIREAILQPATDAANSELIGPHTGIVRPVAPAVR